VSKTTGNADHERGSKKFHRLFAASFFSDGFSLDISFVPSVDRDKRVYGHALYGVSSRFLSCLVYCLLQGLSDDFSYARLTCSFVEQLFQKV